MEEGGGSAWTASVIRGGGDVAARGIHVDGIASVIHFDVPEDAKAYVHRSGRTARAGRSGVVVTFVQPDQVTDVRRIQRLVGLEEVFTDPEPGKLRTLRPAVIHAPSGPVSSETKPASENGVTAARP